MNEEQPPQDPILPTGDGESSSEFREMPVESPRASLILREDSVREERVASMEAANRSLADALRITYRLLQGVLIILLVLFLFSGLRQVDQSEIGLKVSFGKLADSNLQPGAHFSLPFPLGEIITVSTAQEVVRIQDSFTHGQFSPTVALANQRFNPGSLNPEFDGMLLTADTNLAHATLSVAYRRARPAEYVEHLFTSDEEMLVRMMAERAIVHTAAGLTIDELLQRAATREPTGEGGDGGSQSVAVERENSIEQLVRQRMQAGLDDLQVGIEIDQATLQQIFAPLTLRQDFDRVNQADTQATQARQRAEQERRTELNRAAGPAHEPLLLLIAEYGQLLEAGDEDRAAETLDRLQGIFLSEDGTDVEVDGRGFENVRLAGDAASVMSSARRYRQTVVAEARRRADTFETKLTLYRSNPSLFLLTEYREAMEMFRGHEHVQAFYMPSEGVVDLLLNEDPEGARQREAEERRGLSGEVLRERERELGVGR